jgi:hypothetical protein
MRFIRTTLLLICGLTLFAEASHAQIGNFGRNKPTFQVVDWKFVQTPHFDIYYYQGMEDIARIATTIAEESYSQLSRSYDYKLRNRIPIVIYRSHNAFTETHLTPQLVGEGTGGFTEFLKNRVAVPFEGSYPNFRHTLHHELAHAVMLDMLFGKEILSGIRQTDMPLWFIEGLAEYSSIPWTAESDMWMRDAVMNDYLQLNGYFAYKGGQSIMYYIAEMYGPEKITQMLHRLRSFRRFGPTMQAVLGVKLEDFGKKWQKDLKKVYWPSIVDRDDPEDVGEALTDHTKDRSYYNRAPSFSPFGDKIAFLTGRDYYASIYVMSAIDGKILWKVVTGEQSGAYEEMHWLRAGISWSPDAKRLAFSAKAAEGDKLYIVESRTGKRVQVIDPEIDAIFSPDWSPDGKDMVFVGIDEGKADIYTVNLATEKITQLTFDRFNDADPKWSRDGKSIVFASDRVPGLKDNGHQILYQSMDIYLMDIASRKLRRLTTSPHEDTAPTWGPDGKRVAFVSDRNGIFNIYLLNVAGDSTVEKTVHPMTNILTGAFAPSWSRGGEKLAFAAFNKGGWDIHMIRQPDKKVGEKPLTPAFFQEKGRISYSGIHKRVEPVGTESAKDSTKATDSTTTAKSRTLMPTERIMFGPRMQPIGLASFDIVSNTKTDASRGGFKARDYHGALAIDDYGGLASYSTLGGVGGALYISASDLMAYHQLLFTASLFRDLRDSDYAILYQYLRLKTDFAIYFSQQRSWYPFESYAGTSLLESGMVQSRQTYFGAFASRPTSRFRRIEAGIEFVSSKQTVMYDSFGSVPDKESDLEATLTTIAFVHDNSLWGMYGPARGSRWRISFQSALPKVNDAPFGVVIGDWRKYVEAGKNSNFAFRVSGGASFARDGNAPLFYVGGLPYWINYRYADISSSQLSNDAFSQFIFPVRGLAYYELRGHKYAIFNAEYRFPLIYFLATGGPLSMFFQNIGGVLFLDLAKVWDDPTQPVNQGFQRNETGPLGGYGYGIRFHLGMMVLKIDAAWKTDMRETFGSARYYWTLGYDF